VTSRLRASRAAHRKCLGPTERARRASPVHRAAGAIRPRAGTDGGAQIHDGLGVVRDAPVGRELFGELPKFFFGGAFT
jgi:hypothetical protein